MPSPAVTRVQETIGRFVRANLHCEWTQAESNNIENVIFLSLDEVSGKYNNSRFTVLGLEFNASSELAVDIGFDSMPPGPLGLIHSITPDATSGYLDFAKYPSGGIPDPNRESPGNVVVTTRNALPGSELTITLTAREKGTARP